jgi:hypothetical protein
MSWMQIKITDIHLIHVKTHNWKSLGNDQVQSHQLKAFSASHTYAMKTFFLVIEEPNSYLAD